MVKGNKALSTAYIIAASGHKVGDPCTDAVLGEIRTNLFATGNFGWHSADVQDAVQVHSEESNPPTGKCTVTIEVDENDVVKGINITGSGPVKPEDVRAALHVTEGQTVYNPNQFLRDVADIQDIYNRKGYIAVVDQGAGLDPKNPGILDVPILVTRVAKIDIVKNRKTKRFVILREMKTKEGDYYNRVTFSNDLRRLYNLDLFDEVNPSLQDLGAGRVGITLSVVEKRSGIVNAGVGFSNREQLVGSAELSETNFRGVGETVALRWEAGGAVNRSSVELGFTEPWVDHRHTALNVQLYDKTVYRFSNSLQNGVSGGTTSNSNRYNEQRTGATIGLSRPFRESYRAGVTVRAENVRTDPLGLSLQNAEILQNGPTFAVTGTLAHDSRDLISDPVSGNYQTFAAEVGQADLHPVVSPNGAVEPGPAGLHQFIKGTYEVREFFNMWSPRKRSKPDEDKASIATRLIIGTSTGTLPFFEQYFVGGAESLRGYREDRFWGSNMILGSIEYRHPLARKLKGVLFLDVGDAWGGLYSNVNIAGFSQSGFTLHPAIGLGIRFTTPLGPLRLDFGFGSEGGRTHFSVGNAF